MRVLNILGQQTNGKILVDTDGQLRRLDQNISLDLDFYQGNTFTQSSNKECGTLSSIRYRLLPDDSIIAYGQFTKVNGTTRKCIARFTPDGQLDSRFVPEDILSTAMYIQIMPDSQNKLIISGQFKSTDGVMSQRMMRMNLDGTVDAKFNIKNFASL